MLSLILMKICIHLEPGGRSSVEDTECCLLYFFFGKLQSWLMDSPWELGGLVIFSFGSTLPVSLCS